MPFSADALIDKFQQTDETFRIPTSDDPEEDLIVKCVAGVQDMAAVIKKAQQIVRFAEKGTMPSLWKPYLPISPEVASIVAEITLLVVEPVFTDVQALKLCQTAGPFASFIHARIMEHVQSNVPQREIEEAEEIKNGLSPTDSGLSGESTSPSDTNT